MFRFLVLLVGLLPLISAFAMPAPGALATSRATPAITMAHHVQKKAARAHNAYRPRKSRPSDIYRKPPSYPAVPDIPWYTKLDKPAAAAASE